MLAAEPALSCGSCLIVFWWILIPIAAAALLVLYGLFRWASAGPEIDAEAAREHFRAEQEWRALRRAGTGTTTAGSKRPQSVP